MQPTVVAVYWRAMAIACVAHIHGLCTRFLDTCRDHKKWTSNMVPPRLARTRPPRLNSVTSAPARLAHWTEGRVSWEPSVRVTNVLEATLSFVVVHCAIQYTATRQLVVLRCFKVVGRNRCIQSIIVTGANRPIVFPLFEYHNEV